ncbi:hypothetical protein OAA09_00140 [bacterium]|nr:hypothetical protein [bacterium]
MASNVIKRGTLYRLSKAGNNGFWYPDGQLYRLTQDIAFNNISWIGFDGFKPVIVNSSFIKERNFQTSNTVIWIES